MNVVHLHDGRPSLNDIPGQLRVLADSIEKGEVEATTTYVVIPRAGDFPKLFGFGDNDKDNSPIVQMQLMLHWLSANLVVRN